MVVLPLCVFNVTFVWMCYRHVCIAPQIQTGLPAASLNDWPTTQPVQYYALQNCTLRMTQLAICLHDLLLLFFVFVDLATHRDNRGRQPNRHRPHRFANVDDYRTHAHTMFWLHRATYTNQIVRQSHKRRWNVFFVCFFFRVYTLVCVSVCLPKWLTPTVLWLPC